MIDVFNDIKKFLVFEDKYDFYFLQILQRRKDFSEKNINKNTTLIKNYYIRNIEYLESRYDDIKNLCEFFNARAMLRLNRRNYKKVTLMSLRLLTTHIISEDYKTSNKVFDQACGRWHNERDKKWIIDLDGDYDNSEILEIRYVLEEIRPKGDKVLSILPTKNGKHIITSVFDLGEFKLKYPSLGVHKDNPINLYIPGE